MIIKYKVLTLLLLSAHLLCAQEIFPGGPGTLGSYRLDFPYAASGWKYSHGIYAPIGDNTQSHIKKGPGYTGPVQTHAWWTSALWDHGNLTIIDGTTTKSITDVSHEMHSGPLYPYPLLLQAKAEGFVIRGGLSDINGGDNEVECHSAVTDTRVGLAGDTAAQTSVDSYGDWHAVFYQSYPSGNTLRMTAAQGCPFAFFEMTGTARPAIYGVNKRIVTKSTTGNSFIFSVAPEGRTIYVGVFFPAGTVAGKEGAAAATFQPIPLLPLTVPPATFEPGWRNMEFIMPGAAGVNRWFSVAIMPDMNKATLDYYEARAFNFITGTNHTYTFNETTSKLTTTFTASTTAKYSGILAPTNVAALGTLQALYKHQYLYADATTAAALTGYTYPCPRGTMKVYATNVFQTVMTHKGVLPNLGWANTSDPVQLKAYIDNYLPTINIPQKSADGYSKDGMVSLATIAEISSQLGYTAAKNKCLDAMESRLTDWFTSPVNSDWQMFVYDKDFNYMAHYPNAFTSSGQFVDMHFHMGYLIYGAAILARYRPAWAAKYGDMVETVIRQINDYRKDMTDPGTGAAPDIGWFPYLRFFDPYAGHSWAGPTADGQESVSEAIMFGYGTFLWGETVNNNNLRNLGALLYITEAEAAKLYWFDVDHTINYNWGGTTYPHNHVTILRAAGGTYGTYFSPDEKWYYSIDILPETAGSMWLIWDPSQAQTIFNDLPAGGYPGWDDHGYHYNFVHAGFDAGAATNAYDSYAVSEQWINPTFAFVNGDIPELYQWDHTLDSVGVYDQSVQANITGFSVFRKDNCKHYMIYMPPWKGPKTVTFSDGQSFNVPNDTVIVYKVCTDPLPLNWLEIHGENINNDHIKLTWSTASEINTDYFEIERSSDGRKWTTIGQVKAAGDQSDISRYTFTDASPLQGTNYYRLKETDKDKKSDYSKMVKVDFGISEIAFSIYPNPAGSFFKVRAIPAAIEKFSFCLKDVLGRIILLQESSRDLSEISFASSDLSSGIYLLEITNQENGSKIIYKIIKE
ncbi:MAG: glycosyl hydrolase [Cytophagaceae bacterium]